MKKEGKRKALSALICGSMLTVALVGGTLAYLTDAEGVMINTFSADKNVDVVLSETVGKNGVVDEESKVVLDDEAQSTDLKGHEYVDVMPGDELIKQVVVENKDGAADAYVAVTVTLNNALKINAAIDDFYEGETIDGVTYVKGGAEIQAIYDEVFDGWGMNYQLGTADNGMRCAIDGSQGLPAYVMQVDSTKTTKMNDTFMNYKGNWFALENEGYIYKGSESDGYYVQKNDLGEYEICYTYYIYLPAGASTTLFEGLNVPASFTYEQLSMFDGLEINVSAEAIQAANFATAQDAFLALADDENVKSTGQGAVTNVAASDEEFDEAISGGADVLILGSGNYIVPDSAQGKDLTIIGSGDTVIATQDDGSYEGCDYSLDGATVTFENITINTDSSTYTGYARLNATYNNCTINGTYTLYGDSVFNNCAFNVSGDVYNIWTWGAPNATFNNCTFTSDGKALLLYGTADTNLTVNNCTFNDNGGLTDLKAAIEIGNDYGKSYELIVNNTVVNGYEINDKGINTGTTLWANKNSMGTDKLNVIVDGVDVY